MASPRWTKILRDAAASRGRIALMSIAIAVSLAGVGGVLGAYAVLTREMAVNYLGTRPAAATLELEGGVDPALVEAVRGRPGIADAEAGDVLEARARAGGGWRRMLLFVVEDLRDVRMNRFRPERGAWPPPDGAMLVERSAVEMVAADVGGSVVVRTAHGAPVDVPVAGVVHDPGLAPAWQERSGYGYVSRATLARLGEPPVLHELRVAFAGDPRSPAEVEARATALASWLRDEGRPVHGIRVPPPFQHPHRRQMVTVLGMLLSFAALALVLSSVLTATSLEALLARQVREIAIMKTLGARAGQLARLYAALVSALGAAALLVAVPLGAAASLLLAGKVSHLLNLDLTSRAIPWWVFAVEAAAGVGVPLLVSAFPIVRAARRTIRGAIDDHGAPADRPRAWTSRLPPPLRSALRRPARLALTLGLLAAGGAMALTSVQVRKGWEAMAAKVTETRHYDLEIALHAPAPRAVAEDLSAVPGLARVEAWGRSPAAFAGASGFEVSRAYPDRGHGSFVALGVPAGSTLVGFTVLAGRWLAPDDRGADALVLNQGALAQAPGLAIGDQVRLTIDGRPADWRLVGVVEEIGSPGAAYVDLSSFERATGTVGRAGLLRAVFGPGAPGPAATGRAIEERLEQAGISVASALTVAELREALDGHVLVLARLLLAMAVILGVVGVLGLVSAMGVSVVERTREFAIMKTLGAAPRRIQAMLLAEAFAITALSWVVGCALAVPLTLLVAGIVGRLGFLAALPLVLSPGAAGVWLLVVLTATYAATLVPARAAARIVIREALERV